MSMVAVLIFSFLKPAWSRWGTCVSCESLTDSVWGGSHLLPCQWLNHYTDTVWQYSVYDDILLINYAMINCKWCESSPQLNIWKYIMVFVKPKCVVFYAKWKKAIIIQSIQHILYRTVFLIHPRGGSFTLSRTFWYTGFNARFYLKHLLNVVVFGLEQLAPRGQVAVSEDTTGL